MTASESTIAWLRSYYEAIDQLQLDRLADFLHEQCEIHYPTGHSEVGRDRILERTEKALGSLKGTEHRLVHVWDEGEELIFELEVTYRREDGTSVLRPGVGIFVLDQGRIRQQRLFVNDAAVWR